MKNSTIKATNPAVASCAQCGHEGHARPSTLEITIKKGYVRRASLAADGVYASAQTPQGTENGVVLMSAILLVERLAKAHSCDPRAVISTMARCFDARDRFMTAPRERN
jgi:hypothetical protein